VFAAGAKTGQTLTGFSVIWLDGGFDGYRRLRHLRPAERSG
jgi:hypothetical protein